MELYKNLLVTQDQRVKAWKGLSEDTLAWKPNSESWSILECLAHLNRYAEYYLPRLHAAANNYHGNGWNTFRSGWIGAYLVNSIKPGSNPLKTPKKLNPNGTDLDIDELNTFLKHQAEYLDLEKKLETTNLNKRSIQVEVMPIIWMKAGDAFAFNVFHQERHILQAATVLNTFKKQGNFQSDLAS